MRFQDLFRGYTGSHGVSVPTDEIDERGKKKHKHYTKPGPPSEAEWKAHLAATGPGLGVTPLLDDNRNVHWGAIDIDKYKGSIDFAKLERDCQHLPLVITYSKSRGAHLWLFCSEPTPAKLVMETLAQWIAQMGFPGSEVFPKQHSRLTGTDDQGNWINLPYYGNDRRCYHNGEELTLEEFITFVETTGRLASEERIRTLLKKTKESKIQADGLFSDGPPCLEKIFADGGPSAGGRNNTMFNVGVYLKSKSPEDWADLFNQFNKDYVGIESKEITDTTRMVDRKEYNYACSKSPMTDFCDRKLCQKREHGIARGSHGEDGGGELNVHLTGLTKIDTTTPRWLVNIDGVRAEIPDTKILMDPKAFGLLVVERVHKVMSPVKPDRWAAEIQRLLMEVEVIEAPIEASPEGQFIGHLTAFIEKRGQSNTRDNLNSGRVWVCADCKKAYFRPGDLTQYLRREGFRDLDNSQIFSQLHNFGVKKGRWNIKGATVTWYSVPMPALQDQPFDVPSFTPQEKKHNEQQQSGEGFTGAF